MNSLTWCLFLKQSYHSNQSLMIKRAFPTIMTVSSGISLEAADMSTNSSSVWSANGRESTIFNNHNQSCMAIIIGYYVQYQIIFHANLS